MTAARVCRVCGVPQIGLRIAAGLYIYIERRARQGFAPRRPQRLPRPPRRLNRHHDDDDDEGFRLREGKSTLRWWYDGNACVDGRNNLWGGKRSPLQRLAATRDSHRIKRYIIVSSRWVMDQSLCGLKQNAKRHIYTYTLYIVMKRRRRFWWIDVISKVTK